MHRREFLVGAGAAGAALAGARLATARGLAELAQVDWAALRDASALAPDILYLNHASIGTIPKPLLGARQRYLEICELNPWLYMWGGAWEEGRELTRARAAELLGCSSDEIALTHNTTEGFNILAQGLPLGPGDEVLCSSLNHAGASVCWSYRGEQRGFAVRQFEFPVADAASISPADIVEIYAAQIRDETRVLVFPHIDNIVGLRYPLRAMATMARERGVQLVAVDGAQSAGMIPVDLAASGVDFYATSPHKWVQAPKGVGLMYVRRQRLELVQPMSVTWGQDRWAGSVRALEDYGTRNLAEVITLGDAVRFQQELGADRKESRLRQLWQFARDRVDASPALRWRSPRDWNSGASLFAVEAVGKDSRELFEALYAGHGAVFRAFVTQGLNTMRLSPSVINQRAEIDRFLTLVESA